MQTWMTTRANPRNKNYIQPLQVVLYHLLEAALFQKENQSRLLEVLYNPHSSTVQVKMKCTDMHDLCIFNGQ